MITTQQKLLRSNSAISYSHQTNSLAQPASYVLQLTLSGLYATRNGHTHGPVHGVKVPFSIKNSISETMHFNLPLTCYLIREQKQTQNQISMLLRYLTVCPLPRVQACQNISQFSGSDLLQPASITQGSLVQRLCTLAK